MIKQLVALGMVILLGVILCFLMGDNNYGLYIIFMLVAGIMFRNYPIGIFNYWLRGGKGVNGEGKSGIGRDRQ